MLKGGGAPGDVDQKAQGSGEDWGDLPAKERAAAMAELAKDLPSHYRELIEEYYRKLAEDPNSAND
jgi:acyl-CoA reductase-like NAD-dependent aldehyde dehydrogenase